jgi:Chaperone of endosialidase
LRSYLLASLKNFLGKAHRRAVAIKRGGGKPLVPLEELLARERAGLEPADNLSAGRIYERRWALTLLELVLTRLAEEYRAAGSNRLFEELKELLKKTDEPDRPSQAEKAILQLRPVSFHYKHELDPAGIPQFGLVAEQVEKVNPDLVLRDDEGKAITVRYEAVNAMLLNEFLKEHGKVQTLETTVAQQQKQIEALTAGLQKVSDKVELQHAAEHRSVAGR